MDYRQFVGRNVVSIKDLSKEEVECILDLAERMIPYAKGEKRTKALDGRIIANLFFEPSTRTRLSFESAAHRLGAQILDVSQMSATSIAKGETLADTIRMVDSYCDAIVMRHPYEGAARLATKYAKSPVINAGDGAASHPTQTLLDLFTNYWHANGSQEGCHFDYESQIKFIQVLEPILRESGLNTVISAADETSVGQAIAGLNRFVSAGVDRYVGQWNTHTYGGSNEEKVRYGELARKTGKHLWMSETGAGGIGIAGNLRLAQRLIDDMRYIQPEAWIDWQYMEEANDQWCVIRGSFANQTYAKVKNFYVRQQCSRFIKQGYDIIASGCDQSLAALSANRDTLVIVVLNEGIAAKTHMIDLSRFRPMPLRSSIRAYRTSVDENLADALDDVSLDGTTLLLNMSAQSITTLIMPVDIR